MMRKVLLVTVFAGVCVANDALAQIQVQQIAVGQPVAAFQESAQADRVLSAQVTVDMRNVPLRDVVDELARKSGVVIMYARELIPASQRVSVRGEKMTLGAALQQVLQGTGVRASVSAGGNVILARGVAAQDGGRAQGVIVGKVIHAKTKQPVANVSVIVDDSRQSVTVSEDGSFRVTVGSGEQTLQIRAVGFVRQVKRVTVVGGQTVTIEVVLEPSANVLDEVVVTGTIVAAARKEISTPITVITAKDIEVRGVTTIAGLLQGEVPGVIALDLGSAAWHDVLGGSVTTSVYSRGASSLDGKPNPMKVYIDGVEIADPQYLGTIDVQSIARIEIVSGSQASTVYGSGAMGGVMQIFTKRGTIGAAPELALSLGMGILQNNFSDGLTPQHNDVLNMSGSSGPGFSYAGMTSYNYVGQWQPALFNQSMGASFGLTYTQGRLGLDGSVSLTRGKNGTLSNSGGVRNALGIGGGSPILQRYERDGTGVPRSGADHFSQRVSTNSSHTMAFNANYRAMTIWQHHLTLGRTQTDMKLIPEARKFSTPQDTLMETSLSTSKQYSASYNTTVTPRLGIATFTMTFGANRSWNDGFTMMGACVDSKEATNYHPCYDYGMNLSRPSDNSNWGGFGQWRLGFFDRIFLNAAVRGERHVNYGGNKIDWTPNVGIAYTMEFGEMTVKILSSYGRSTRPPGPNMRDEMLIDMGSDLLPHQLQIQRPNADLRPERSVGPQSGIELYYGNRASFSINRYRQNITDLIQPLIFDTVYFRDAMTGDTIPGFYQPTHRFVNVANVRTDGWDGTGSLTLGPVTFQGTYSWVDTRVVAIGEGAVDLGVAPVGQSFTYLPSHTGNISVNYARRNTSMMLSSNWIGATLQSAQTSSLWLLQAQDRFTTYRSIARLNLYINPPPVRVAGRMKSNLTASQRVNKMITATLNITNVGNSSDSQVGAVFPTLGRMTQFGVRLLFK